MPRSNPPQLSFSSGELSPRLLGRLDFQKYASGLALCENLIPTAEGVLLRRSGTRYISATYDSSVKSHILPFQFSTSQAYIIELGDTIARFYRNQSLISVAGTDAQIQNGDFPAGIVGWTDQSGAGSSIAHDATNFRLSLISNGATNGHAEQAVTVTPTTQSHVLKFTTYGAPGDQVWLRIGTTSTGTEVINDVPFGTGYHCYAFTPGAGTIYVQFLNKAVAKTVQVDNISFLSNEGVRIDTPYAEDDLYNVNGPQSADVLYLYHEDYPTYRLERHGHTAWSLEEVLWEDGPWLPLNETSTMLNPGAATGLGVTVVASAITGINRVAGVDQGFLSTDVGRNLRLDNPATGIDWGWAVIVSVTNTTTVVVDIKRDFSTANADARWRLGAWSGTTGYPRTGVFFQQRLMSAGNTDDPQTFDASNTSDFQVMSPDSADPTSGNWDETVADDDSFRYTISAAEVNAIRWMSPARGTLLIGTTGGEWSVASNGPVITPTDVVVRSETRFGSATIFRIRVGNAVLYVQKAGRKIRELAFDFGVDSYVANDMTRLAEHITHGGIVEFEYAEEPDALVWVVLYNGQLLSMTYRREEDVVGWARHIIGGSFSGGIAQVECVAVIEGTAGAGQVEDSSDRNEVWVQVKRTINGSTVRYLEMIEVDWDTNHAQEDAYYSDSLITYDGAAATVITGLDHLEGETVQILADGAIHTPLVVSGGQITLTKAASVVQMGLGYTHKLNTLRLLAGAAAGTPLGRIKRVCAAVFDFLNSHTFQWGPDSTHLNPKVDFRQVSDLADTAVPYFSGLFFAESEYDWTRDPRIYLESSDPVPFGLRAIIPEVDLKDLR